MKLSNAPEMPWLPRWSNQLLVGGLVALAACAPSVETPAPAPAPVPGALPGAEPEVRVGLVVDQASVVVGSTEGFELSEATTGREIDEADSDASWTFTASQAGELHYSKDGGGAVGTGTDLLVVRPEDGGTLLVDGKPYRGVALVRTSGSGRVTAINRVDMENYLLGVVPREIGSVGEDLIEAAKAQAVAARTYAVAQRGRRSALGFDYYATTSDQVYGGLEAEHAPVSRAVRSTAGEILTYQGEPIEAYYHSTCAGQTAAIDEVWDAEPRPYLVSVVDINPRTGEAYDVTSSRFSWTEQWTDEQLEDILDRTLADSLPAGVSSIGDLVDLEILRLTPSDRVEALRISTTAGNFIVGKDYVRRFFLTPEGALLNSSKFVLELERDAEGRPTEITAIGGGWGHGIGMCQVGAMGRARAGQDYQTILQAYYPHTQLVDLY
ncbi:MAG TPA: SpoIID/LytB domain-containing protein [Longimicrobiaceae bacterium]|nr:SpoIID/LytB domain-containing protein [Longimicrobiaceae bacterium]